MRVQESEGGRREVGVEKHTGKRSREGRDSTRGQGDQGPALLEGATW